MLELCGVNSMADVVEANLTLRFSFQHLHDRPASFMEIVLRDLATTNFQWLKYEEEVKTLKKKQIGGMILENNYI